MAQRIDIDGLEIAYEDSGGDGPAVVLVHGLGGSMYGWRAQSRALADAGYRAIAYDQRGAGLTRGIGGGMPPGPYSVEGWAEDLIALVDALGLERMALVGHSMGCMVAEHAVVVLGERCWALALCGARARWPEGFGATFEERARLARQGRMDENAEAVASGGLTEGFRAENPVVWGLMVASLTANDPDCYAESALATTRGSMVDVERLACPVFAFTGSEDAATPPEAGAEVAAASPRGESAVIDGAAHWCMLEAPGEVNSLLTAFFERHRPN